jgi:quinol monooxygenase YgiN
MVRLAVALSSSAPAAHDLLEALRFLIVGTRIEEGCLGCSVWVEPDSTVQYVEEWASEAAMRRRVRSDGFTSLLAIMESARDRPRVQFDFVTRTRGLDYIEEIRGRPARDPASRRSGTRGRDQGRNPG